MRLKNIIWAVKAGLNGGFKSMGDRMVDANGVLGMVKYAAARSGSKYVLVERDGKVW